MTRPYTLKRRAEQQAETRQRIVEAAVALHATLGPARTPVSAIAERAGVQRHTLYAHFPDERSLFMACSGDFFERDPLPDPEPWRAIAEPGDRLRTGLAALYGWYARNAGMTACVLRDAEHHELVAEIAALRMGPTMLAYAEILGAGLGGQQPAMLQLMLSFYSWRSLMRDAGRPPDQAVALALRAILSAPAVP